MQKHVKIVRNPDSMIGMIVAKRTFPNYASVTYIIYNNINNYIIHYRIVFKRIKKLQACQSMSQHEI